MAQSSIFGLAHRKTARIIGSAIPGGIFMTMSSMKTFTDGDTCMNSVPATPTYQMQNVYHAQLKWAMQHSVPPYDNGSHVMSTSIPFFCRSENIGFQGRGVEEMCNILMNRAMDINANMQDHVNYWVIDTVDRLCYDVCSELRNLQTERDEYKRLAQEAEERLRYANKKLRTCETALKQYQGNATTMFAVPKTRHAAAAVTVTADALAPMQESNKRMKN